MLLDEKAVYAVIVQTAVDGGNLVIADHGDLRMKDRRIHGLRINVGVVYLENRLHDDNKDSEICEIGINTAKSVTKSLMARRTFAT